jgi:hypothetical protein
LIGVSLPAFIFLFCSPHPRYAVILIRVNGNSFHRTCAPVNRGQHSAWWIESSPTGNRF